MHKWRASAVPHAPPPKIPISAVNFCVKSSIAAVPSALCRGRPPTALRQIIMHIRLKDAAGAAPAYCCAESAAPPSLTP